MSILEAKNLFKDNKYLEAINLLESLPDDRYKFYEFAKAFLKIGGFDKAVNNIFKVIEIKNNWPGAYAIAGHICLNINNLAEAISNFSNAIIDKIDSFYQDICNLLFWYVDHSTISVVMRNEMNNSDASLGKLGAITSKVIIYPDAPNGSKDEFVNKHKLSISREAIE